MSNVLVNIVSFGFIVNGFIQILFSGWLRNVMHFPADELLFPLLEIASGFIIVFRWRLSKIVGSFSRIAGLLYAGLYLAGTLLLPFYKEFQFLSVKLIGLVYFCFYLFCILVLSNRSIKALFPSAGEQVVIPVVARDKTLSQLQLNGKTIRRISFWVKLIAIAFIIDSISVFFLSFLLTKGSYWYEGFGRMLLQASGGSALLKPSSGTRKWASWFCLLGSLSYTIFTLLIYLFLLPDMMKADPEIAQQFIDRPYLFPLGLTYGVLFYCIFFFLNRPTVKRYFETA